MSLQWYVCLHFCRFSVALPWFLVFALKLIEKSPAVYILLFFFLRTKTLKYIYACRSNDTQTKSVTFISDSVETNVANISRVILYIFPCNCNCLAGASWENKFSYPNLKSKRKLQSYMSVFVFMCTRVLELKQGWSWICEGATSRLRNHCSRHTHACVCSTFNWHIGKT